MSDFPAVRYFRLVSPPRTYFLVGFALLVAMGIAVEFIYQGSSDFASSMILLVQMFAVSTGFAVHASRGYFDPALTGESSRVNLAAAHFAASALPGVAAWAALGAAQALRARSLDVPTLRPGGLVALLLISSVCWAATLPLPPLSGAGIWLIVSIGIFVSGRFVPWMGTMARDTNWFAEQPGRGTLVGLSFPMMIPGAPFPTLSIAAFVAVGGLALLAGSVYIGICNFSLAEEG
jgi:hypothetical protein